MELGNRNAAETFKWIASFVVIGGAIKVHDDVSFAERT